MQFKMNRYIITLGCILAISPDVAKAQITFTIPPDSIVDYSQYDRIETCDALFSRMTEQLSEKHDSIAMRRSIFLSSRADTTSSRINWSIRQCMKSFDIESIGKHDSVLRAGSIRNTALKLYYVGGYEDRFSLLADSIMRLPSRTDSGYRRLLKQFAIIETAIKSQQPTDWKMIESLQEKYLFSDLLANPHDIGAKAQYYSIFYGRALRSNAESIDSGLDKFTELVGQIQGDIGDKLASDSSYPANRIKGILRDSYDRINYMVALDSLASNGPEAFFRAFQLNHELAGLSGKRDLPGGMSKKLTAPKAFVAYQYEGEVWQASHADTEIVNSEYQLEPDGRAYVVLWLDALCREENQLTRLGGLRDASPTRNCWPRYEWIKWFKSTYPDIPVKIITATVGHFSTLAMKDPYEEAELIKESWWGFHKLPADIVIYYRSFFNMHDVDGRREDVSNENMDMLTKTVGNSKSIMGTSGPDPVFLVAPDGTIVSEMFTGIKGVERSKKVLDAFYKWYKREYPANSSSPISN